MSAVTYRSFAKVNLHLQVVGRRADGYHELRTVFQSIDLHDLVTVEPGGAAVELTVVEGEAPRGEANLAWRAAAAYLERFGGAAGVSGARLALAKRVPAGGGLGGGSSNAATVLAGLDQQLGAPAPPGELWRLARELGADVPFFLVGGTALGVGRGDEVVPLPDLEERDVWLAMPAVAVSTAEVFSALPNLTAQPLDSRIMGLVQRRMSGALSAWVVRNDLEPVVFGRFPEVRDVYDALAAAGADAVQMSGSGATLFALFRDPEEAMRAAVRLPSGCRLERARTLSRSTLTARRIVDEGLRGG